LWIRQFVKTFRTEFMNLTVWLPTLFVIGLATMGLLFAFVWGCEKV
jgi:hypothetical protein